MLTTISEHGWQRPLLAALMLSALILSGCGDNGRSPNTGTSLPETPDSVAAASAANPRANSVEEATDSINEAVALISLPEDEALLAELSAFRFGYTARGQIKLEPKSETEKRVGRSPDRADAVALGFWGASGIGAQEPFMCWSLGESSELERIGNYYFRPSI